MISTLNGPTARSFPCFLTGLPVVFEPSTRRRKLCRITLTYVVNEESDDVEIDWDSTAEDAQEAYEAHPGIGVGNVKVAGGPWPGVALHVIFQGDLSGKPIDFPSVQDDLTGGGSLRMWKASSANWKGYE